MPMDRSKYQVDWERIAFAYKESIGWKCEECDIKHMEDGTQGIIHPHLGISINSGSDTSKLYAGVSIVPDLGALFISFSLGGAVHNGDLVTEDGRSLGSRLLFRLAAEVGIWVCGKHRVSVMFDHVSNGGLASRNAGLDTIGIRYSFQGR